MGAAPSKPEQVQPATLELNQQIIERLRLLDLENRRRKNPDALSSCEKGYVVVEADEHHESPPPKYSSSSSASHDLSISEVQHWSHSLLQDPKNRLAVRAFTANPANAILSSRAARLHDIQTFNVTIPLEGSPVTNQRASGRCWLFAATNVFRVALMRKYSLKDFELSQAYLFFWDKLEKANYFLENVLDTVDEPLDGRLMQALMSSPVGDGGQWDMVANLVNKYGLVPHDIYPDSFNASNSSAMSSLITTKLREDCIALRALASPSKQASRATILSTKQAMVREIHQILTLMLGPPPSPDASIKWEYYTTSGAYHSLDTTPLSFAHTLSDRHTIRALSGTDVHSLLSLVHDPRHAPNTLLTVSRLGNITNARPVTYINVSLPTLKSACIAMLRRGLPVFFGSDVGKFSDSSAGIMDTALYDYELGFNVRLGMSKSQRLQTGESAMTHAMTLTGVHVDDKSGESVRWRVQNSWGEGAGSKGYFVMTDKWLDEFVYQAVVDPSVVAREVRDVLGKEPTVLPLWDPMGALA